MKPVIHKKTGSRYIYIQTAIDCTNERDGTMVVIYMNNKGQVFVREQREFWQKFMNVENN